MPPKTADLGLIGPVPAPADRRRPWRALALIALLGAAVLLVPALRRDASPPPRAPAPTWARVAPAHPVSYRIAYLDQALVVAGCALVPVDLDEPRVRAGDEVADVAVKPHCDAAAASASAEILPLAGVIGAEVVAAPASAGRCADVIRRSPLPAGRVGVRKGDVLCLLTARVSPLAPRLTQKLVVLTVTGAGARVSLLVSAWAVLR
ncbi:hypothetical protein [Actinoplanes sp. NPDC023714]|uniref:hypothetical protein n=1 Tax=Actinoplanes sp. NPDC023714 TaxID=3154322 RepID=UPI0033F50191